MSGVRAAYEVVKVWSTRASEAPNSPVEAAPPVVASRLTPPPDSVQSPTASLNKDVNK